MKKVYVITAGHNRNKISENFIDNLLKQKYKNIQLIFIDDGSTDGTGEMVKNKSPNSVVIKGNGKLWWSGALHEAYKWIYKNVSNGEDYIFIANDDITIDSDFIYKALEFLNISLNTFLTGTGYDCVTKEIVDGPIQWKYLGFEKVDKYEYSDKGNCASTRALFFRVKDFKKVGGFHPILLPHYGSDYEFTNRAYRKGFDIKGDINLCYTFSRDTTGNNQYINEVPATFIKKLFSRKSVYNPVYGIILIILITPWYLRPIAIILKIGRYFVNIFNYTKHQMTKLDKYNNTNKGG